MILSNIYLTELDSLTINSGLITLETGFLLYSFFSIINIFHKLRVFGFISCASH